jgi:hypothetical protein
MAVLCGASKEPGKPLCHDHYWKLDPMSRRRLYLRIGHGFEIAYTQALRKLGLLDAPAATP